MKATTLRQVISKFNEQAPLNPEQKKEWKNFYVDTQRLDINRITTTFISSSRGHKLLFGGHSGNGTSTELNKLIHDPKIRKRFAVIKIDILESLNPTDIEIVELLLVICFQVLNFAEKKNIKPDRYITEEFEKIEGFFRDKLKIESSGLSLEQKSIGIEAKAGAGIRIPFLSLASKFYAKMVGQMEAREIVRKEYRPRLNELIELVKLLLDDLKAKLRGKEPFIVIDGLDRTSVKPAEKLFVEDGPNIAMLSNATMLLTVPISLIHSVKSAQAEAAIGKIWVLKNMRLLTKDKKEDGDTQKNRDLMRRVVLQRLESGLIDPGALETAIDYSGGVFRTLFTLIAGAAVEAETLGKKRIGPEEMRQAVTAEKIKKSRPLSRSHWEILLEIEKHKNFLSEMDEKKLELLAGLFALEYINGDEWYAVNPLLQERLESYQKLRENE